MIDNQTIARPYAKAIFEIAVDKSELKEWADMLEAAAMIVSDKVVQEKLESPMFTFDQTADLVYSIGKKFFNEQMHHALRVMAENKRLFLLPEILAAYSALCAEKEHVMQVEVVSAMPMAKAQEKKLKEALAKRYDKEIEMTIEVDSSIIGGAVIKMGDRVLDGSVRGQLDRLKEKL